MIVPGRKKTLVAAFGSVLVLAATLMGGPAEAVSGGTAAGSDLGYVAKLSNSAASCTGVLINPSWVLTAGGCFGSATPAANGAVPLATTVVVGRSRLSATTGHQVTATRVIPHPTRDLALVGLSVPVTDVTPARLSTSAPDAGQALVVSSFGRTADRWTPDQLQSAAFAVTTTRDDTVNVEGSAANVALCRGDAGAPAVRTVGAVKDVVGLGSSSLQGGCLNESETSTTGVLARVDGLTNWISASTESSGFVPLPSMPRVFDSRNAIGVTTTTPLPAEKEYAVQVLGVGGIPATNVAAVILDLSVHDQTDYTQVKLWADGTTQPSLQGLVHSKAGVEPLGNSAVIPVGANGKIRLWHASGTAHVVVDVQGYLTKTATIPTAGGFVPITQTRMVDTRDDITVNFSGAIPANGYRTFVIAGSGIPAGTEAIFANVSLFGPTDDGFLRMLPGNAVTTGTGGPDVSFPKRTYSAGTTIKLSGNTVTVNNHSAAAVQMAIDVQGYFSRNAAVGGGYHNAAGRVLDTRTMATRLAGGATLDFKVAGVGGIPTTGGTSAALNIHTYKSGQEGNSIAVWPTGTARPAAVVHYQPGNNATTGSINRTSLAIIPTGTDGNISVRNNSTSETDVYIELEGWFQDQAPAATPVAPVVAPLGEDFLYPGAAEIALTQNVHLITGDGNIQMVACSTPAEGDVGVIRVRTTETIGSNGNGLLCFKVYGTPAHLELEVPAVYEIRGDGLKSGAGHQGVAKIETDSGVTSTVAIAPSGSIQVGVGADPENEPTTLLQLNITG